MTAPSLTVDPVKRFVAILWNDRPALEAAIHELAQRWGPWDCSGRDLPFDVTDYYLVEMGANLSRRIVSFEQLISPEEIAEAKLECHRLEERLARTGQRRVNLDVGYLDHHKIVLASMKPAGQKIYLSRGVYADLVARFQQGRYQRLDWTFPDFRDGRYDQELSQIRSRYLQQVRKRSPGHDGRGA